MTLYFHYTKLIELEYYFLYKMYKNNVKTSLSFEATNILKYISFKFINKFMNLI